MRALPALFALLSPGCLLAMPMPEGRDETEPTSSSESSTPGDDDDDECRDRDCKPYRCSKLGCKTYCLDDGDCARGYICSGIKCEEPCVDEECPDGFVCYDDPDANSCMTRCLDDFDCQPGWSCCGGVGCPAGVGNGDCY